MSGFDLQQKQQQSQVQVMTQKQIQSLSILSMSADDLKNAVYAEVEKNPALIIRNSDKVKTGRVSMSGVQKTEDYQAYLENCVDERKSLKTSLSEQINMIDLSETEKTICERLIGNLDDKGFHVLAPVSLLDKKDPRQTKSLLDKCISLIQHLEPEGTCVKNMEESLFVQALMKNNCPDTARFILDGHFDFLNPPEPAKILRKLVSYQEQRKSMFGLQDEPFLDLKITEHDVIEALNFIRTLDPFPARNYSSTDVHFVTPDVYVERLEDKTDKKENFDTGIVFAKDSCWQVKSSRDSYFDLAINPSYAKNSDKNIPIVQQGIKEAADFIAAVQMRQNTVIKACSIIVKRQHEFFEKGIGHLVPLKQMDIANIIGVHESTISRMANGKYIQCEWGLFNIKYFFTNAVTEDVSKDKILAEIEAILNDHKNDKKKLSDQKISDILQQRGIKIARRTVAKYRSKL